MGSDPAASAVRGQQVQIWVDVINNGPSALTVPVQLAFPSDEKQPERKSPWIEPGQTARVEVHLEDLELRRRGAFPDRHTHGRAQHH